MGIVQDLNWRASIKAFDASKKLTDEQVQSLTEALRLSASSFGLQPWHFVVISDQAVKDALVEHSWNQPQVKDASHVIVLCRKETMTDADVDTYIKDVSETRGVPLADLEGYAGMMKGFLSSRSADEIDAWTKNQVYIALGTLLTAAAVEKIDSCPMEGFIPEKYDEVLGLKEKGLKSTLVCPIGYRDENDKYSQAKKVRYSEDAVISYI
jgi:nitroreductase